jgi:hypothetical protein
MASPDVMPYNLLQNDPKYNAKDVPKVRQTKWRQFRIDMPYGCYYNSSTKEVFYFNRDYKRLGVSREEEHWTTYPEQLKESAMFYSDGTKPLSTKKAWQAYQEGLALFKDYTVVTCPTEVIPATFNIPSWDF